MCLTVVGLSVGRGSFGGRRGLPYGGDEHNVDAATQGASPLQVTVLFLTSLSSGVFKQHGEKMPENSRIVFILFKFDNGFEKHTKLLQNY